MKTGRIALCGVLLSATAYAQNPPPTEPPAGDPAPPPTVDAPPPTVEVTVQPKTEVVVAPRQQDESPSMDDRFNNAGLLFNLNNVFTAGGVLGGWQGFGFGAQKALASGSRARIGVDISRQTDPVNIVKTTRTNGMDEVVSYDLQLPGSGFSGQHSASLVIDVLKPLMERSIAPYIGAGAFAAVFRRTLGYTDDLTITDQVTEVDNSSTTLALGVRGIAGVGWQLNERFSLFAEYHLTVNVIAWQSDHTSTTTNNTASGVPASNRVETEFKETRFLNLDTALGQGGALGLIAHF